MARDFYIIHTNQAQVVREQSLQQSHTRVSGQVHAGWPLQGGTKLSDYGFHSEQSSSILTELRLHNL